MNIKSSNIVLVLLSAFLLSCSIGGDKGNSNSDSYSDSYPDSYLEEVSKLGFPTGEIDRWINNAMYQYNCELVKVTSVEADGDWCLKLYMDVVWYRSFRDEGEPYKAVLNLGFEPSTGHIWDGSFRPVD